MSFRPRWYRFSGAWKEGPRGVVQTDQDLRNAVKRGERLEWPEGILRLAQEEYDRQHPGQPYERIQERGGLSVKEIVALLSDHVERLKDGQR